MKSILPIILVILFLTGAITYSLSKRAVPVRDILRFGIPANELESATGDTSGSTNKKTGFNVVLPTSSVTPSLTPTKIAGNTITPLPTTSENDQTTKGGQTIDTKNSSNSKTASKTVTTTTKTVVCTPVYGAANTCTEHVVVDTGAENAIFFNFAGLSYLAGLASFVFAKRA
ncbi:MAG: hypothetical protein UW68_C0033G0012 [Candidatus Collierbacteria bacterium GW2011_GWB1_44_6]|uniref:Uncharacterized protein n=1 Tax=Candidatus Collierbacteria bacterium GW2011_GWB1_44_6 TaxID=1618384 RepID=A0A0G1JMF6_9BACT|nr:MAG: hypothetical protein UW68_C0033G0012 [Candidatus Collierbacteria bacterium GW2011_GWB1_44_6]